MSDAPATLPTGPVEGMADFEHAYADVNGTRIHYVIGGRGPAVVLLHGWPYTWLVWQKMMPLLAESGYTVIAPDLRGTGDSLTPVDGYSKVNVATDVHELVTQLGIQSINLVGMDIGTMVAFAYAASFPDEVQTLVLSESVIPGFGLEELMNPATGGYWHFGFFRQVRLATMLTTGHEAEFLGGNWKMGSVNGFADEEIAEYLRQYSKPEGLRGGFEHYGTLLEDGQTNRQLAATPLTMPVLVLNGDGGLPQDILLDGVSRAAVSVESDILPAAGHAFAADNPDAGAERLHRFFAANAPTH